MNAKQNGLALGLLATTVAGWLVLSPPIAQPQHYHRFADTRALLGIGNAADTLSNLAFLLVGVLGLAFLAREALAGSSPRFERRGELRAYGLFFAAIALTSAGSAYYHLAPDDARLFWDRLPMSVAFMTLVAAMIAERVSVRWGLRLVVPLALLGAASVVYWRASALLGAEDLRPYLAVQYGSMCVVLAMALFLPSRYTRGGDIVLALALYTLSKLLELYDGLVYAHACWVSGHTLKHLLAAAACYVILRSLQHRGVRPW